MGPLHGMKVVELAGIGPGPMCAMLLADLGATVLRVDRKQPVDLGTPRPLAYNLLLRNRHSIAVDLKQPDAVELVLKLVGQADALIEGFRPGVAERLGLGPDVCLARNAKLVYGRMTGWGQEGPLARAAGHDLNYIAITGALAAIGRKDQPPTPPLNLLGDYAGGSLYLAMGILAGIIEARQSGKGQVVDAAIVDGTANLMTSIYGLFGGGLASLERGTNSLDSGAHYYDVYQCADGEWISVAPIEGRFYADLLKVLEIAPETLGEQRDKKNWERAKTALAAKFKTKTRGEWVKLLEGSDACFAPVLSMAEAPKHPHLAARQTFIDVDGVTQPAPAPRFSRTVPETPTPPEAPDAKRALEGWLATEEIAALQSSGVL
ncbi:MAG TPA: CaiB/BaiF CoA-transferase family protein [Burkholderiales bacterium]|nr:CaiB/BaiF CoA-transferase family protein [Burkholderiales bacterium]